MAAISRHMNNVSKHRMFSNVQNQANNWENNNKRSKKTLLRNFPFSYLCTSIMTVPQVFSANGYKVMYLNTHVKII